MGEVVSDPKIRAKGYDYSNVMCFCKIDYAVSGHYEFSGDGYTAISWDEPMMQRQGYGDYGVIIKNQSELVRRLSKALDKMSCHYLFGNVHYHPLQLNGKKLISCEMITHLQRCDLISIKDVSLKPYKYDAFDKWDKHAYENEWRLIVNRYPTEKVYNKLDCKSICLDIGDLSDIVVPVSATEFVSNINKLFYTGDIVPSADYYKGNISRRDLRNEFYKLSNDMAYEIISLGKGATYNI